MFLRSSVHFFAKVRLCCHTIRLIVVLLVVVVGWGLADLSIRLVRWNVVYLIRTTLRTIVRILPIR